MLIATVTTQRSGSKLLANCFGSGTQVRPYGEIFNPESRNLGSFATFLAAHSDELTKLSANEVLDQFFACFSAIHGTTSFDIMFNQLEWPCTSWNPYDSYFIYGYLIARRAVIISLERSPKESFASAKYLEHSKRAHKLAGETGQSLQQTGLTLNIEEYRAYHAAVLRQRRLLYEAMTGYEHFIRLSYADLAQCCLIPEEVREVIVAAGKPHDIKIDRALIQIHSQPVRPTGVEYARAFVNIDALD